MKKKMYSLSNRMTTVLITHRWKKGMKPIVDDVTSCCLGISFYGKAHHIVFQVLRNSRYLRKR